MLFLKCRCFYYFRSFIFSVLFYIMVLTWWFNGLFLLLISYPKRCSLLKCNLSSSSFPLYINKAFSSVFLLRFFKNKPFHRKKIIEVIILYPCNKLQRQPFSYSFHLEKVIKKALQEMLQFIHLHSRRTII